MLCAMAMCLVSSPSVLEKSYKIIKVWNGESIINLYYVGRNPNSIYPLGHKLLICSCTIKADMIQSVIMKYHMAGQLLCLVKHLLTDLTVHSSGLMDTDVILKLILELVLLITLVTGISGITLNHRKPTCGVNLGNQISYTTSVKGASYFLSLLCPSICLSRSACLTNFFLHTLQYKTFMSRCIFRCCISVDFCL